ncbi:MAG: site-specific integrase, partial [Bacteroidota bacterium]
CYCGLRHSDIKTLRKEHIQNGYIVKQMEKDRLGKKKTVRIPMKSRLLSLLNLDEKSDLLFEQPVQENGTTNNYLKEILKIAEIGKHVTFHGFRHTFAINSLLLGLKIEVVSDILGH